MNTLSLHLVLALSWVLLTGDASVANILFAAVVSFCALVIGRRMLGCESYLRRLPRLLFFLLRLVYELFASSVIVVVDVYTPKNYFRPRILKVPIRSETDMEITWLANCISLTPGTTTLDVTPQRDALIIHAMYAEDALAIRRQIIEDLEPRLLAVLRDDVEEDETANKEEGV